MEKFRRGRVDDAVHGAHESGEALVVEHQNHTRRRQLTDFWVLPVLTPDG